jgi:hypothetical protein
MNNTNDGGPAFPIADPFAVKGPKNEVEALRLQSGMTLRDYFAAKAMQGMLADPRFDHREIARLAYSMADVMIKARQA